MTTKSTLTAPGLTAVHLLLWIAFSVVALHQLTVGSLTFLLHWLDWNSFVHGGKIFALSILLGAIPTSVVAGVWSFLVSLNQRGSH